MDKNEFTERLEDIFLQNEDVSDLEVARVRVRLRRVLVVRLEDGSEFEIAVTQTRVAT